MGYCPVCDRLIEEFAPGPGGRLGAACPNCGVLERHRVAALLIPYLLETVGGEGAILEAAPQSGLSELLADMAGSDLVRLDLSRSSRRIDVQATITELPIRSHSCRFVYCSHVLEHVADDRLAMAELVRVLHLGGLVYIQVPRQKGVETEEDLDATPEELLEKFGQADHVRLYGDDLEDRLTDAGLIVTTRVVSEIMPPWLVRLIGGKADEEIWLASADRDPSPLLEPSAVVDSLPFGYRLGVMAPVTTVDRELETARAEAEYWRNAYLYLRNRLPVRFLARVRDLFRL